MKGLMHDCVGAKNERSWGPTLVVGRYLLLTWMFFTSLIFFRWMIEHSCYVLLIFFKIMNKPKSNYFSIFFMINLWVFDCTNVKYVLLRYSSFVLFVLLCILAFECKQVQSNKSPPVLTTDRFAPFWTLHEFS